MDQKRIDTILNTADEFGSIAKKVNESSKIRKENAVNATELITKSLEICKTLNSMYTQIGKEDEKQRNQDSIVSNTCMILKANIKEQEKYISKIKNDKSIDQEIVNKIIEANSTLSDNLKEIISTIDLIVQKDNDIILMDDILIMKKKIQLDSLLKLKKLTEKSLFDASKAIEGSSSNLKRGTEMVKNFQKIKTIIEKGDKNQLKSLADEAKQGWKIAVNVNNSSKVQSKFTEEVNKFTKQLHKDSSDIKDLSITKHHAFENNLQNITVLTILLSMKLPKYLSIEKDILNLKESVNSSTVVNNLKAYIKSACKYIKNVSSLNYDMTDTILLNNQTETKTVSMTENEIECFDSIKNEISAMTEATKFPIDGSKKNIEKGKFLEKELRLIIKN